MRLNAQASFFNFNYPGPYTLSLGPDCNTPLQPQLGTPVVTSTVGANIIVSQFDSTASGFGLYTHFWTLNEVAVVNWFVQDNMGNSHTFIFPITFADTSPPVFDLTGINATESYNSIAQVPPAPTIPVADNCTPFNLLVQTFTETSPPPICGSGTFTRTWTAADTFNNLATFVQTIHVFADTLPPAINGFPQNGSAPCNQLATAYPAWLGAQMSTFHANDPSTPIVYTNNAPPVFPNGCAVPITVKFTATDACAHKSTVTVVFTTSDTSPPQITRAPKDSVVACTFGGDHLPALGNWIQQHAHLIANDACSLPSEQVYTTRINGIPVDSQTIVTAFLNSFGNGCGPQTIGGIDYSKVRGMVTVEFQVTDPCGNLAVAGQATFAAIDTLPPTITMNPQMDEQCGGGNDQAVLQTWINNHGNGSLNDDCSTASWTTFTWTTSTGVTGSGNFGSGPYPQIVANNCSWYVDVQFGASDDCGNLSSKTARFQIFDDQAPVLSAYPLTDTIYCPNAFPTVFPGTVSDNCDANVAISHAYHFSDTTCIGNYSLTLTWTATDDCGNTSTAVQTYFVRDTLAPVFTLVPANITASCENYQSLQLPVPGVDVTASDVCGSLGGITIGLISNQDPNPAVCGHYSFVITRLFTASDQCGNTATSTQAVQVLDNIGPVLTGLLDTTIQCDQDPLLTPGPAATDNCSGVMSGPLRVNTITTPGPCTDNYTITYVWEASDVCNNIGSFSQNVHLQDTVKPTLMGLPADIASVECDQIPDPPAFSNFTTQDNCDADVDISFNEHEIRDPNTANCAHWNGYTIVREWTVTDNCGNARTYTQNIVVEDHTPPIFVMPPAVVLDSDQGVCGAYVIPPAPLSVYDLCSSLPIPVMFKDSASLLTSNGQTSASLPVGTMLFNWPTPNMPPENPAIDTASLLVSLRNADADGLDEYLLVYGENGYLIGRTAHSATACSNSDTLFKIAPDLLNTWLADGQLEITLQPYGTGSNALNPYCPGGGKALLTMNYHFAQDQVPLDIHYSIDGGLQLPYPTANTHLFSVGAHTVVYFAEDCVGNKSSATVQVQVNDVEAPTLSTTPPGTVYVGPNNCVADQVLPFPSVFENCGLSGLYLQNTALTPVHFENNADLGLIPSNLTLTVGGALPNAVTGGRLKVRFLGDNNQVGEFFNVLDENSTPIGGSAVTTGSPECTFTTEATIAVNATQINSWAADGLIHFTLVPNKDLLTYTQFINPCQSLLPDGTDGSSVVQIELEYDYAIVNYEIRKGVAGPIVATGTLFGNQTTTTQGPGEYYVKYTTSDAIGLMGMTNYTFLVRDTIRPSAFCANKTIYINPSGEQNYTLLPSEINAGSTDNCSGSNLSFQINPSVYTCNQAGSFTSVTLTVIDSSGNTRSCQSLVRVETLPCLPTYSQICTGDTLSLAANPPATQGGNSIYTYMWSGPNGYISNVENPIRINANASFEGAYTIKVTGLTGCTSTGTVVVDLVNLATPILSAPTSLCKGENVFLETSQFGNNATYLWYSGTPSSPTFLGVSSDPLFTVNLPAVGTQSYFVQVSNDGCLSMPSTVKTVQVFALPVASVDQSQISLCECQPLALGSPVMGVGYQWTGPNGFNSSLQYPPVKSCVSLSDTGTYQLIVYKNGCASLPVNVHVQVIPKPPTPLIIGAAGVCAGANITLSTSAVAGASQYVWSKSGQIITTAIPQLVLSNLQVGDSGPWQVYVVGQGGCHSDPSALALVDVQPYPQVAAEANTPLCLGTALQLMGSSNIDNIPIVFKWVGPGGFVSFSQNPSPPPVAGSYILTVTTSNNCAGADTVDVVITTPPTIVSALNNAPTCASGPVTVQLSATVNATYLPLQYLWQGPGGYSSTMPNPTLFNPQNGSYVLTVWDSIGCKSSNLGSTAINIHPIPATPILAAQPPVCEGTDVTLQLSNAGSYSMGDFKFIWTLPGGNAQTTTQPVLLLPNAQVGQSGAYSVVVSNDTCTSLASVTLQLQVNPIPAPPVITAIPNPVCSGATLQLSVPQSFSAYQWSGPMGFSSAIFNPSISNMTASKEGVYYCRVTQSGCTSPQGEGIFVQVLPTPIPPAFSATSAACLGQMDTVRLTVNPSAITPGAQYTWFNALNMPIAPGDTIPFVSISNFTGIAPGQNTFYAVASLNGCASASSAPVAVQFDFIPANQAYAGNDRPACDAQPISLQASAPTIGSGLWTQVGGPALLIANPDMASTTASGQMAGNNYTFVWSLSNGACENYSKDTLVIHSVAFEQAMALPLIDTCFAETVMLLATQGQSTGGVWSQPQGQQLLNVQIADPLNPQTIVSNLEPGSTYFFTWTLADIGCGTSTATVTVRTIGSVAFAGDYSIVCNTDSCTLLQAGPLPDLETGLWTSNNPFITIASPANEQTSVCGLQVGTNVFYWTTNNGACGNLSRDTAYVYYELTPSPAIDSVFVPFGTKVQFDVLLNDILPQEFSIVVLEQPKHGRLVVLDDGFFSYQPDIGFHGVDRMLYQICNLNCPDACRTAQVVFVVANDDECVIPTVITPNGDGVNDVFFVPCLMIGDGEPIDNEVTIFNQWGDAVFHAQPYTNNWEGTFNGEALPPGTYYYLVKFNGDVPPRNGFLIIQH